ncbi:MAG: OB-fold putative lipoprotein [Deltaproteobacteria bacterium]|nr:OB-fold putative lipoprotein [Deltaproteobacteria bacterium]
MSADVFGRTLAAAAVLLASLCASPLAAQEVWLEPVVISPRQLMEAYLNDFHAADARYTGRLLVVTGRIKSVFPPDQTYRVHPYPFMTIDSGPYQPIIVYLWNWEADAVKTVRPGRTTTVMGFCQGVTPQLSLTDACLHPGGCGGPVADFYGPYFRLPPTPPRQRRQPSDIFGG